MCEILPILWKMAELQLSQDAVSPETIERILSKVGAKVTNFSELVSYFIRHPDALHSPKRASNNLGIPVPLLRSIAASTAMRRAIFEYILTSAFNPDVLQIGFNNLAHRVMDKRTSTKDLLAILSFIGRVQGIEARARVTHDVNVNHGITVVVSQPYGPEDVIDAEFVEAPALTSDSGGGVVPPLSDESGEGAGVREEARVSEG